MTFLILRSLCRACTGFESLRWSRAVQCPMSIFCMVTMQSRRPMATNQRASSGARLEGGISIAYPASRLQEQVLITTLRLPSSGVLSGIARSVLGELARISGGRSPVRCGARASACSPTTSAETRAVFPIHLGTFNGLFPRGAYFGPKFALIGPAHLLAVQPQFWFHPLQNVTGDICWIWFWRESTKDALYSFSNVALRPANLSNARYIGTQPNLEIRWAISEHFLAAFNVAGFLTGTFLQQIPSVERYWFRQCWPYVSVLTIPDDPAYHAKFSVLGTKIGVNYVLYAMTTDRTP